MKNWGFNFWTRLLGGLVFLISFSTYFSTLEPNLSFWDTGEYIASAVKLQVTHAPGAAFFQIVGAALGIFSFGDVTKYSFLINTMSGMFSALAIWLMYGTLLRLGTRMLASGQKSVSDRRSWLAMAGAVVGSLCFAFSDSFWFSAVEGEVYSMASLFIAALLRLIMEWDFRSHEEGNERWLILIFFLVGLSVGVHMMVMLAIPAVCLLYYARKYTFSWRGFAVANGVTLGILLFVFKIIFPVVMTLFGRLEILLVNTFGLPFHSGTLLAFVLLVGACVYLLRWAGSSGKNIVRLASLSVVYMLIGFSCWLVIPIRANANPPMNLNNPDTAIGMRDYYNRVQYGDWPTSYGQNYTAHLDPNGLVRNEDGSPVTKKLDDIFEKDETSGRYEKVGERTSYVYHPDHVSILPRMYNEDKTVMNNYIKMYGAPDFELNTDNPEIQNNEEAKKLFQQLLQKKQDGSIDVDDYLMAKKYDLLRIHPPSLWQNLDYFFSFQNGYYFVRYLMWNFVGRQNGLEGHMENNRGNWVSGISAIDNALWGNQDTLPDRYRDQASTHFYFLPLLLGLIGFFFQLNQDFKRFYALLSLFILTSVGIIFYTGVKPFEVRERDYALVGAFYGFALWIGLGVTGILDFFSKKINNKALLTTGAVALAGVPLLMAVQGYPSHDRSRRYAAYDFAYSLLESQKKNTILFVYGDNDTYPVWGLQETEKRRTDVKVINYTLLATAWNIDQVKRRTYQAAPIPSVLQHNEYREGKNDQIYVLDSSLWRGLIAQAEATGQGHVFEPFKKFVTQDKMTVKEAIHFLRTPSPAKDAVLKTLFGEENYLQYNILPVAKLILPVNKANAIHAGILRPQDAALAVDQIEINYQKSGMYKSDLIMLDMLAHFDWKRPIAFSSGGVYAPEQTFFLNDYLEFNGFSYTLVPIKTPETEEGRLGRVDPIALYHNIQKFRWGNFKDTSVYMDETCTQNIISYRNAAARAAQALYQIGQRQKAHHLLQLVQSQIPAEKYNDVRSLSQMVTAYILTGQEAKGLDLAEKLKKSVLKEYDYFAHLPNDQRPYVSRDMNDQPALYTMLTSAVLEAYHAQGNKDKAYQYLLQAMQPVDHRFNNAIQDLRAMGTEKAYLQTDLATNITPFYQYLFQLMRPYDSTFANEKMEQITRQVMQVAQ